MTECPELLRELSEAGVRDPPAVHQALYMEEDLDWQDYNRGGDDVVRGDISSANLSAGNISRILTRLSSTCGAGTSSAA